MPRIARVEPLVTTRAVRGPFDYRAEDPAVGQTLIVPFAGRRVLGVVVGVADESEVAEDRLAAPVSALAPGVPPDLVELAGWIATQYCSTPARALQLMLPPGTGRTAARAPREREVLFAERAREPAEDERLTDAQRAVLARLADGGPLPATATGTSHDSLRRLAARGLISLERRAVRRVPGTARVGAHAAVPPALTRHQEAALARVESALAAGEAARLLLHGVTGSGKTEVYLRAARTALAAGRGVIVLVPEIALTPQTLGRFADRLGDTVAVLHSGLSAGERYDEWLRLRRGEARVAVGPRSAVFAPVADLGLVIVDEEHESSYKNEGDPRYDARTVAAWRARHSGAVLLAGSATPRPESVHRLERVRLPERVDARPLPPVHVLDMRERHGALHPETRAALADVRHRGGKAIVLLNRRGWANFLSCRTCGHVWECPQCDVALVLHRGDGEVRCHHCGHREPAPARCPECGGVSVARHGAGTQRLEHELEDALGGSGFPIFRLDADATARRGVLERTLAAFGRAPGGVLVGTQLVAKGHDFPDVTLGVVLDADATLRFPDFRAEERTFALLAQLAGRAGRGDAGGRVLVQTLAPDAAAIRFAAGHDADGFLSLELGRREALGYPPFRTLIRVVASAPDPATAQTAADAVAARLHAPGARILGPAPLFRLRNRERRQILIKAERRGVTIDAVAAAVDGAARDRATRGAALSVDVDPQ